MVVLFDEIGAEGLEVSEQLTPQYLQDVLSGDGHETELRPAGPGSFKARLRKVEDKVLLEGKASLEVIGSCKRCLAETRQPVKVDFELSLVRKPATVESDEGEAEPKKLKDEDGTAASFDLHASEEEFFEGREIDLGPILREQVLLALPMDVLCKESCKGLCTVCGCDLNERECGCDRHPADPRWSALKNIKLR